jgi:hypothetical protein
MVFLSLIDNLPCVQDNIIADYKEITKQMSEKLERKERGEAEERAEKEGGASPLEAALARIHELELGTCTSSLQSIRLRCIIFFHSTVWYR